jgi:hypothetical protein
LVWQIKLPISLGKSAIFFLFGQALRWSDLFAKNGNSVDTYRYFPLPKRKTSAVTGPPMVFQTVPTKP